MKLQMKKIYAPILAMMAFFVVACVVDEAKLDDVKKEEVKNPTEMLCTSEAGDSLKLGEELPSDDCNTCVCGEDGQIACTEKACLVEDVGGCLDDKGQLVPVGQSFMRECNTCVCGENGGAVCTKIGCSSNPIDSIIPIEVDEIGGCLDDKGQLVLVGESFMRECNTCICGENGGAVCTKIWCLVDEENAIDSITPIEVQEEVTACTTIALDAKKFCALLKDGSEKIFYNKCEAEKLGAKFLYYGECMELVVDPVVCPAIYLPVCGKTLKGELKTFGNSCEANGAKAIIQYEGECLD